MQGRADDRAAAGPDPTEPPGAIGRSSSLGVVLCIVAAVAAAYLLGFSTGQARYPDALGCADGRHRRRLAAFQLRSRLAISAGLKWQ